MSIWNKVLVALILIASLGLSYLAVRTLRTHQNWRQLAQDFDRKIRETEDRNRLLIEAEGDVEKPGIKYLELQLRKLPDRNRVWRDCVPQDRAETPQNGLVSVTVKVPGIGVGDILHVFEAAPVQAGGRYLGAMKVVAVGQLGQDGLPIQLQPSMDGTPAELQRLAQSARSRKSWLLYETLPADTHEAFDLREDELTSLVPEDGVEQYVEDGEMLSVEEVRQRGLAGRLLATTDDGKVLYEDQNGRILIRSDDLDEQGRPFYVDEDGQFAYAVETQETVDARGRIVYDVRYLDETGQVLPAVSVVEKEVTDGEGKFARWLHDYKTLLEDSNRRRSALTRQIQDSTDGLASLETSLAEAGRQLTLRESERTRLLAEFDQAKYQRDAVHSLLEKLQREVAGYQETIGRLIDENIAVAVEIDEHQQRAKQRIDAETGAVVRSAAGF